MTRKDLFAPIALHLESQARLMVIWLLVIFSVSVAQAQSPHAGLYNGNVFVTLSGAVNVPERPIGIALLTVNGDGTIVQNGGGLSGTVDDSGKVTWVTPNALYLTTGQITGPNLSATGSFVNNGLTTTFRLEARNLNGTLGQAGSLAESMAWVNSGPFNNDMNDIVFGDGRFVAVGNGGLIEVSTNGVAWSAGQVPTSSHLYAVTFGNGTYVAVGESETILTSPDGVVWTPRVVEPNGFFKSKLTGAAFGGGRFVVLGDSGRALTSTDGIAWTTINPTPGNVTLGAIYTGLTFLNGRFVAHGFSFISAFVATSTDGLTWTTGTIAGTGLVLSKAIAYGNGKYAISTTGNRLATSSDGLAWTVNANVPTMYGVTFINGQFLGVDQNNFLASTDAATWSRRTGYSSLLVGQAIGGIAFGNGVYVAVGGTILTSSDGVLWTEQARSQHLPTMRSLDRYAGSGGTLTAVGDGGYFNTSTSGENFASGQVFSSPFNVRGLYGGLGITVVGEDGGILTTSTGNRPDAATAVDSGSAAQLNAVVETSVSGSPFLIAVGNGGTILTSLNRTNWSQISSGTTADLASVAFVTRPIIAVGKNGTIIGTEDGTNWTARVSNTSANLNRVMAYSGTLPALWVAVGDQGTVVTSTNGTTWESRSTGTSSRLVGVAYADRPFVGLRLMAISEDGLVLISDDRGTNWSKVVTGVNRKVTGLNCWFNTGFTNFVAVGENGLMMRSGDGQAWVISDVDKSRDLLAVTHGKGRFVAVGDRLLMTSRDGVSWKMQPHRISGSGISYGNGFFVSPGGLPGSGTAIATSPDASNWTVRYTNTAYTLVSSAFGAGVHVVVGNSGRILVSSDGLSWNDRSLTTSSHFQSVSYVGNRFIALGSSSLNATSADGITWSQGSISGTMNGAAYGNGLYVLAGDVGRIVTSTNGTSWTSRTSGVTDQLNDVAYVGGRFVVLSARYFLVSTNGIDWKREDHHVQRRLTRFKVANGALVAVGEDGTIVEFPTDTKGIPLVTKNPVGQQLSSGATLTLSASVSGDEPLVYEWYKDGRLIVDGPNVTGAATATLSIQNTTTSDGGAYELVVSNGAGSRSSEPAEITIAGPPVITRQPVSQVVAQGAGVAFTGAAFGPPPLSYQWYRGNTPIIGAVNPTFVINGVATRNAGTYSLVVSNNFGSVTSRVATLSVQFPAPVNNDASFPNFTLLSDLNGSMYVSAVKALPSGQVLIGGNFNRLGPPANILRYRVALVTSSGDLNTSFVPPVGPGGSPFVFLTEASGSILVGGDYRYLAGPIVSGLLRLGGNGTFGGLATDFAGGAFVDTVIAAVRQPDNRIIIGGEFGFVSNPKQRNIARLLVDGAPDPSFAPPSFPLRAVRALAVQPDGKILAGGSFAAYANNTALIRFNADGSFDTTFSTTLLEPTEVDAIGLQSDGRIIIGGNLSFGPVRTNLFLARLNANGTRDTTFKGFPAGPVAALAIQSDDAIVFGGNFFNVNGRSRGFLARVTADGNLDQDFASGLGANRPVMALDLTADDKVVVGGLFTTFDGVARPGLARVKLGTAAVLGVVSHPQNSAAHTGETVTLSVAAIGQNPLRFQWKKDGVVVPGATNTFLTLENLALTNAGNYTVTVTDSTGNVTSEAAALTVTEGNGNTGGAFGSWAADNGLTGANADPGADPDGDGIPNLFEFYFGSNPLTASRSNVPVATTVGLNGQTYPAISFIRPKSAAGITATVQVSTTAAFGDSLDAVELGATDLGNGTERVTVRSSASGTQQPIQFLRLRLVAP